MGVEDRVTPLLLTDRLLWPVDYPVVCYSNPAMMILPHCLSRRVAPSEVSTTLVCISIRHRWFLCRTSVLRLWRQK
jgi:hypothetical protein